MRASVFRVGLVHRVRGRGDRANEHGYTLVAPECGRPLVYFTVAGVRRRIVTSVVRRLLDAEPGVIYCETDNSVYRIDSGRDASLAARELATAPPASDCA
jgi:uncharacterized protein YbaR (Trm112 family)